MRLFCFVLWGAFFVWCLVRYRKREGVPAAYSKGRRWFLWIPLLGVFAAEIWLIFFVGVPTWSTLMEKLPATEQAVVVEVVAEQYAWNVHYPGPDGRFGKREASLIGPANPLGLDEADPAARDDAVSLNELHAPLGKRVLVHLTSKDVIHSFFVPEFRIKRDAVPGMRVSLWFEPIRMGRFEMVCAQLCGLGHYRMRGDLFVESQEEFDAWLREQSQGRKG